ncbi:uncharacterized protein CTRU02_215057 [Colletotrichum truncatum]|uniref:Uncharacterized protein n=1 Tax=Colletotrichum truncatum TaxID=5467 RepID=A0ACC3YEH3_COLTU|nr:uncharacterized protein CTRU02_08192 [Colletotrichum truncatum]KAF6790063.1 hypothetical protein CTRU02_08192 [Colletotrichum truncatum]
MDRLSATTLRGARLLGDVQETNLEKHEHCQVLITLRSEYNSTTTTSTVTSTVTPTKPKRPKFFPIPVLNALAARNFRATQSVPLAVTGRQLPLIYRLVSGLVSAPYYRTVLVFDTEHRFDATRLSCSPDDLRHVYVHRPAFHDISSDSKDRTTTSRISPNQLRELVMAAENWMFYGAHDSSGREWWGTIVIGALGAGDITAAWKGWLRVERANVPGFSIGCSAQEALSDRQKRQDAIDATPWAASSQWGNFNFTESHKTGSSHNAAVTQKG